MLFAKILINPCGENVTSKAFDVISNIVVNDKLETVEVPPRAPKAV